MDNRLARLYRDAVAAGPTGRAALVRECLKLRKGVIVYVRGRVLPDSLGAVPVTILLATSRRRTSKKGGVKRIGTRGRPAYAVVALDLADLIDQLFRIQRVLPGVTPGLIDLHTGRRVRALEGTEVGVSEVTMRNPAKWRKVTDGDQDVGPPVEVTEADEDEQVGAGAHCTVCLHPYHRVPCIEDLDENMPCGCAEDSPGRDAGDI